MAPWVAEADRVYGKDGMNQHVRGNFLGCNPDYQQNGYAREANLREAEKLGVKVIFGSSRSNVRILGRSLTLIFVSLTPANYSKGSNLQAHRRPQSGHRVWHRLPYPC